MKLSYVSTVLGVFAIGLWGCSSSEHQLGESSGGAGGGGNSGGESAGGESARGGSTDTGGALNQAGASNHAGAPSGGSSGNDNAAGESAAGASTDGGAANQAGGGSGGGKGDGLEAACTQSGGKVTTSLCCGSATDFPNQCAVGACGCAPTSSHEVKVCSCPAGTCFNGQGCGML